MEKINFYVRVKLELRVVNCCIFTSMAADNTSSTLSLWQLAKQPSLSQGILWTFQVDSFQKVLLVHRQRYCLLGNTSFWIFILVVVGEKDDIWCRYAWHGLRWWHFCYFNGVLVVNVGDNLRRSRNLHGKDKNSSQPNWFLYCREKSKVNYFSRGRHHHRLPFRLPRISSPCNQQQKSACAVPVPLAASLVRSAESNWAKVYCDLTVEINSLRLCSFYVTENTLNAGPQSSFEFFHVLPQSTSNKAKILSRTDHQIHHALNGLSVQTVTDCTVIK